MADIRKPSEHEAIDGTAGETTYDLEQAEGAFKQADVLERSQCNEAEEQLDGIAFIGNTLGPLFYYDPKNAFVQPSYEAFASLDPEEASKEWPYVSPEAAKPALDLMTQRANQGVDDDMVWEYRRLFVGPNAKAVPPWGSVYTDRECVVFGEATLELRQWMKRTGVACLNSEKEPEDHIGLMLMMLSWIRINRPELTEEYLRDHLLTWASHFLEEMEEAAEHPFYEGLARLTRLSLEGIQTECGIEVDYPRFYR